MKLPYSKSFSILHTLIISLLLVVCYYSAIASPTTLNIDGDLILTALGRYLDHGGYWSDLFHFRTFDFQPVRDLSLAVDIIVARHTGLNLWLWQNFVFWGLACHFLGKIIQRLHPTLSVPVVFVIVFLFAIYPLFSATLLWGMARKHLLALCFTLIPTPHWIEFLLDGRRKHLYWVTISYFLAVFAQPIGVFWPVWAAAYAWSVYPQETKHYKKLIPCFVIAVITLIVNYYYYWLSPTFAQVFNAKFDGGWFSGDKLLALGHYLYQLLMPYHLSYNYSLGSWTTLAGLGILLVACLGIYKYSGNRAKFVIWSLFIFAPLAIVTINPLIKFDSYLLLPAVGVLLMLLELIPASWFSTKYAKVLTFVLILIWLPLNFIEAKLWSSPVSFYYQRNFLRQPSCESAQYAIGHMLINEGKITEDLRQFTAANECFKMREAKLNDDAHYLRILAGVVYTDKALEFEKKTNILENLGRQFYYPKLLMALNYYENNMAEKAQTLFTEEAKEYRPEEWDYFFDYLVSKELIPYCEQHRNSDCLKITSHQREREKRF